MSYPEEIELAQYIVERFKQLDVKQVFGVPGELLSLEVFHVVLHRSTSRMYLISGDFTLELLDFFEK